MYAITKLGDKGIIWIILALLMLVFLPSKYRKIGFTVVLALVLSVIMCNGIMKNLWQRVRPFNADTSFENLYNIFASIHDWSFPSGHTSASFAAALAIFMWDRKKGTWAIVGAVLIALSRLYLTVHYPTDVLASLVLGSLYGVIAYFVAAWAFNRFSRMNEVFCKGESYRVLFGKGATEDLHE
jgi:undecaprenyl-diphosphatase